MVDGSLNLYSHLGKLAILTEAKYMPHSWAKILFLGICPIEMIANAH
jgi:hypothetical protein